MYCLSCGARIPNEAIFCLNCGTLTPRGNGVSGESKPTPVFAPTSSPSNPYAPRPSTSYGPLPFEADTQSIYAPPSPYMPQPPPPPHRRRFFPIFLGLFLLILLLGGGLGALMLFKQSAPSPSVLHSVKPTATPQPTVHSVTPTPNTTSQFLPGTWTQCAVETATCTFSGTMTVAFGANGSFHYATASNGTACTLAIFGDPLPGTQKACYREVAPPTTNVWVRCAAENATCSFLGTMTVAFGAKASFKYATKTNGVACSDSVFGDPLYSVVKSCYLLSPPTSITKWNSCAAENITCSFAGRHEVAYGANGQYFYGIFTNGTVCSNSIFGDPASGVAKTCYYQ
jgi:hypothetical protein